MSFEGVKNAYAVSAGREVRVFVVPEKIDDFGALQLAKNIALRNNEIDIYNLNIAVQKIIDRIIFLRIAEDKEIESYEQLLSLSKSGDIFKSLNELFVKANKKYNAGLFQPENWLSELKIDDKVLSSIIKGLYYPECPYEFSILPIEILGNIYEQFLGKTIRFRNVKEGQHTAVIEEKPEVRKAGGVYYTPQYIVNYIVENTIGEKIKEKTPDEISALKVCDPACGSGSFLVGAYQYLLNYHIYYWTKEKNIKKALKDEKIYQVAENNYKLTIEEKQKILINNIYGVDIDPQAVEVTKLSLYLKLLENEGKEAEGSLFKHSDLKLLPTLDSNIKCGNSLIGSDFYTDKDLSLFGNDEMRKVNVFDWDKQFPEVFKKDGFDVVIGNPPYGAELSDDEKNYLITKFKSYEYQINSFSFFIELAKVLLKMNGFISLITPSVFINQHYFMNLRKEILDSFKMVKIIVLNYKVFQDADTGDTCIFVFEKESDNNSKKNNFLKYNKISNVNNLYDNLSEQSQIEFYNNSRYEIILSNGEIFNKIAKKSIPLKDIATCIMGIKPYQVGKGKPKQNEKNVKERNFDSKNKIDNSYKQYLIGKDIDRYIIKPIEKRFIKYGEWLAEPRFTAPFEKIKIIMRQTSDCIRAVIDDNNFYNLNNIYNLEILLEEYKYQYILGIINSKLMVYVYQIIVPEKGRLFAEIKKVNLDKLPIKVIDFSNPSEKSQHDRLVSLVNNMLDTQKLYHNAKSDSDINLYKQKIDLIDNQIDRLVYELYGLTEEEIKIVEGYND